MRLQPSFASSNSAATKPAETGATLETRCLLTVVVDGEESYAMDEGLPGRCVADSPQQVADEIKRRVFDVGVDGVIINLPTHRHTPGVITKVGEALRPLVA